MADATQDERWLPIMGYEGHYEVSDHGRVRSLPRKVLRRDGVAQPIRGRVLKPGGGKRHQHVNLALNGVHDSQWVHRLVLQAFVGPCPPAGVCCHWDDDPTNNLLSNLRWGTRTDNTLDSVRNGTNWRAARQHCRRSHPLSGSNLIQTARERRCRACERATRLRALHRRRGYGEAIDADMQALSDHFFTTSDDSAQNQ